MCTITPDQTGSVNLCAFLDVIAHSELGDALLAASDDGYDVIVGSTPQKLIVFSPYTNHPHRLVGPPTLPAAIASTAAGRYQLLARYFDIYKLQLKLPDFGKMSQDMIALQQIRESLASQDIVRGDLPNALSKCAHIWASLPGSKYGQHTNDYTDLRASFLLNGGSLAPGV